MNDAGNKLKKMAGEYAAEFIQSHMVIGLGTGSTVYFTLHKIRQLLDTGMLKEIYGIPTSEATVKVAEELGIPLNSFENYPEIDLTIDGADEIDPNYNLIKGGGGALLREKIVAQASRRLIIIADETKVSEKLGLKHPLPVEVLPFALIPEIRFLETAGATVRIRKKGEEFFITDQGNYILDCNFGIIEDPESLDNILSKRAGIVEHGLFIGLSTDVVIAGLGGIRHIKVQNS